MFKLSQEHQSKISSRATLRESSDFHPIFTVKGKKHLQYEWDLLQYVCSGLSLLREQVWIPQHLLQKSHHTHLQFTVQLKVLHKQDNANKSRYTLISHKDELSEIHTISEHI